MAPRLAPDPTSSKGSCGDGNALLDDLPARLRDLRRRRGHTLTELAARTGVSLSTLSRLESGLRRPTLDLLLPLARIYGVTLDDLVGVPPPEDPSPHRRPFRRGGVTYAPLTKRTGGLVAFTAIHPGQAPGQPVRQVTHPGRGWLCVLRGELRIALADHDHVIPAGEVAEFDTGVPHGLASATSEPVDVLTVLRPHGDRIAVHAL